MSAPVQAPFVKTLFTADGSSTGIQTVASTAGFRLGAVVYISNTAGLSSPRLIVDYIYSTTQIALRDPSLIGSTRYNASAFTVAGGAYLEQEIQTDFQGTPGSNSGTTTSATTESLTELNQRVSIWQGDNEAVVTAFHNADNQSFGATSYGLFTGGVTQLYNGSTLDRQRSASAANMAAAQSAIGATMSCQPGCWSIVSAPAAATQATVTRAAGGAAVRHVCNTINATIACGATAQTPINVYIRDGASGAGTILWAGSLAAPVNGSGVITVADLDIVGSANTQMTVEFSAAGVAASLEAVTLTGFDVI